MTFPLQNKHLACILLLAFSRFDIFVCLEDQPGANSTLSTLSVKDARLVHGASDKEGMVEIGTGDGQHRYLVCYSGNLYYQLALTVCNSLGYPFVCQTFNSVGVIDESLYEQQMDVIDRLECPTGHDSLQNCTVTLGNISSCNGGNLGIVCSNAVDDIEVRLVNGTLTQNGIVEIRCSIAVGWMRICGDDQWDQRDGKSICKTMGAPWASDTYMVRNMDTDTSLIMAIYCSEEDEYFLQCERNLQTGCPSSNIAVLDCGEDVTINGTEVRTCGARHSCSGRCEERRNTIGQSNFCYCDDLCPHYRDCCHDFDKFCVVSVLMPPPENDHGYFEPQVAEGHLDFGFYRCREIIEYIAQSSEFYYLVSKCSPKWTDTEVRNLCENEPVEVDVIRILPVYDQRNVAYKNVFCAACHGVQINNTVPWEIDAEYKRTRRYYDVFFDMLLPGSFTDMYSFRNPKSNVTPRFCHLKNYSACHEETRDSQVSNICESFNAPVRPGEIIHKNAICATCDIPPSSESPNLCKPSCELECPTSKHEGCGNSCSFTDTILSISLLFNFGNNHQTEDRIGVTCDENEFYDIFARRCRVVACSISSTCLAEVGNEIEKEVAVNSTSETVTNEVLSCIFNISTLGTSLKDMVTHQISYIRGTNSTNMEIVAPNALVAIARENSLRAFLQSKAFENPPCHVDNWEFGFNSTAVDIDEPKCKRFIICNESFAIKDHHDATDALCKITYVTYSYNSISHVLSRTVIPQDCWELLDREIKCSERRVFIPFHGITVTDWNESVVKHIDSSSTLKKIEIQITPDGVWACTENIVTSLELVLHHVETIFGISSSVSLLVMIAFHFCYPTLMNVQGKCVVAFTIALLIGQGTFKINTFVNDTYDVCLALAIVSHFAWLCAFTWMAVIAVRITKTFTQSLRVRDQKDESFWLLAVVGFGVPSTFVVVATVLQFTSMASPYSPSTLVCFLYSGWPSTVFVTGPNVFLLMTTLVLLTVTVVSVHRSLEAGKRVKSSKDKNTEELFIIVKLAVLLGLPWILSLLQGIFNNSYLRWISVTINSLQGVMMLLTFLLTPSVRKLFPSIRNGCRQRPGNQHDEELNAKVSRNKTVENSNI